MVTPQRNPGPVPARTPGAPRRRGAEHGGGTIAITRNGVRTTVILTAAATAAGYILVGLPAQAEEAAPGSLRLMTVSPSAVLDSDRQNNVNLTIGAYLAADRAPFEVRLNRRSYHEPITATQVIRHGGEVTQRRLPNGLVNDFTGFPDMVRTTVTDAKGKKVVDQSTAFCPNTYEPSRLRPDAPTRSGYPTACPEGPAKAFALGTVLGVEGGWAANVQDGGYVAPVKLPPGKYTAKVEIAKKYRDLFGIAGGAKTVKLTVKRQDPRGRSAEQRARSRVPVGGHMAHWLRVQGKGDELAKRPPADVAKPKAAPPKGAGRAPATGPRPDLRSLPAFNIVVQRIAPDPKKPKVKRDYLTFAATVWNGGTSPLVVDGFRRPGKDTMDAYQYFFDAKGNEVGHARTGDFQWDPRPGHIHWHFLDFANYSLTDAARKHVVKSQKESFCLANTDAVDYTIPYAKWRPSNTDLSTACGSQWSASIREVLEVGSGDTYDQYLPGQAFDLTGIRNGTYHIKVTANPVRRLHELDTGNNVSYRKVVIGGTAGKRTVTVPPVGLVKETPPPASPRPPQLGP